MEVGKEEGEENNNSPWGLNQEELFELQKYVSAEEIKDFLSSGSDNAPPAPDKYDLLLFLREVFNLKKNSVVDPANELKFAKTGNLDTHELGYLPHTVRRYFWIGDYAEVEGLDLVADYVRNKSRNLLATSLSKKGFLLNTAITQKRVSKSLGATTRTVSTGMFGSKEVVVGEEE